VVSEWPGGFQGEVVVRAGPTPINGWTVRWTFPAGQRISQLWNGTLTTTGADVTVRNAPYNGSLPANGTTTFGFLASWTGSNTPPAATSCTSP
jgi:alpha-L-fucosidase 2